MATSNNMYTPNDYIYIVCKQTGFVRQLRQSGPINTPLKVKMSTAYSIVSSGIKLYQYDPETKQHAVMTIKNAFKKDKFGKGTSVAPAAAPLKPSLTPKPVEEKKEEEVVAPVEETVETVEEPQVEVKTEDVEVKEEEVVAPVEETVETVEEPQVEAVAQAEGTEDEASDEDEEKEEEEKVEEPVEEKKEEVKKTTTSSGKKKKKKKASTPKVETTEG